MSDTPETDVFIRTQLAQVGMNGTKLSAKLTLKCEKLERERNELTEALEYILGIGLTEKTKAKAEKALQTND